MLHDKKKMGGIQSKHALPDDTIFHVSREMLFPSSLNLSPQIRSFYQFHVYYTTRKILYEMGGIQSKDALPDDTIFKQRENAYDVAS